MSSALSGGKTVVEICSIFTGGIFLRCVTVPRILGFGAWTRICISKGIGTWSYLEDAAVFEVARRRLF